jgi:diguanylate cyclase (GGDEF)-like protein
MKRLIQRLFYGWRERDALTGLCNRKRLFKDLNSALKRSTSVALILADVDEFRYLNTAYGHEFGDSILRQMAKVLRARCVATGTLGPYRDGGESFSFVVSSGVENSRAVAEALRADVEHLRFERHRDAIVTIRLAIAVAPADGNTPTELWDKVSNAVYCPPSNRRRNQVA